MILKSRPTVAQSDSANPFIAQLDFENSIVDEADTEDDWNSLNIHTSSQAHVRFYLRLDFSTGLVIALNDHVIFRVLLPNVCLIYYSHLC